MTYDNLNKSRKTAFADTIFSIAGLVIMNIITQFVLYPFWNSFYGDEKYGTIVYLISAVNIVAVPVGCATANTVIKSHVDYGRKPDGVFFLIIIEIVAVILWTIGIGEFDKGSLSPLERLFYGILGVFTMLRYYASAKYIIKADYKGYFFYFIAISIGYLLGIWLVRLFGIWMLGLIPGELLGTVLGLFNSNYSQTGQHPDIKLTKTTWSIIMFFLAGGLLNDTIMNADRLLIKHFVGSTAVTLYYLSSLFGRTVSLVANPLHNLIIGYLAKLKLEFNTKLLNIFVALSLLLAIVGSVGCTLASYIVMPYLYGESFEAARSSVWICSIAQVVFFSAALIIAVLFCYVSPKYQLYINIVYAVSFVVLCVPLLYYKGLWGFYIGMVCSSFIRYFYVVFLGYNALRNTTKQQISS